MTFEMRLSETTREETRSKILAPLRAYNTARAGETHSRGLAIELVGTDGQTVGGLWGSTGYEWLFVQLLVVPAELRGQGTGRKLMQLAESEALARGCHSSWLDTFEFQARPFYERLGYACFGQLAHYPTGFARFFMQKRLTPMTEPDGHP